MGQSYHKIWIHVVWSTKNRVPIMKTEQRRKIIHHLQQKSREFGYLLDELNRSEEHLHGLVQLYPTQSLSTIMNALKGECSNWINAQDMFKMKFAWQRGYGAFSVSESQLKKVRNYIRGQEEHHRKKSYGEELAQLTELRGLST